MSAESDLRSLLRRMRPALRSGTFVFVSRPQGAPVPPDAVMAFHEKEGVTLVLPQSSAPAGRPASGPHAWIVLQVESDLASVGFLAKITEKLAASGISTNAVSAYYHDHLFVPQSRAQEAVALLLEMQQSAL